LLAGASTARAQQALAGGDMMDDGSSVFMLSGQDGNYLGVSARNLTQEEASRYNLREARGVVITNVTKDGPAEKAGLRKDDVILKLDGETVTSVRKLNRLIGEAAPGQTVRLTISRNGAEQQVTATLGKRASLARNFSVFSPYSQDELKNWEWRDGQNVFSMNFGATRRIGVSTTSLTKQLADYFGVKDGRGVLVNSVTEDGPAARAGIKAGDVITAIDGEPIDDPGDLVRAVNRKDSGDVTLTIIRNKTQQTIKLTPEQRWGRKLGTIPDIRITPPDIRITPPAVEIAMPSMRIAPRAITVSRTQMAPMLAPLSSLPCIMRPVGDIQ
jgi:PDZ domain-containing secreted protein